MDTLFKKIKLKRIGEILYNIYKEPENYQIVEILLSIAYLFIYRTVFKFSLVLSIFGFDLTGRLVQRKFNGDSEDHDKNRMAVDRITELFIFSGELSSTIGKLFFFLALLNTVLTYHKIETDKSFVVNLKLLFLILLGYRLLFI